MKKEEVHMDKRLEKLVEYSMRSGQIDGKLYEEYDVKRGLRDSSGKGVLTGLTEISDVVSFGYVDGENVSMIWCLVRIFMILGRYVMFPDC